MPPNNDDKLSPAAAAVAASIVAVIEWVNYLRARSTTGTWTIGSILSSRGTGITIIKITIQESIQVAQTNWRSQAVELQVSIRVKQPRNGRKLTARVIEQAIRYRAEHGTDPPGMKLRIIRWRHYNKSDRWHDGSESDWKSFSNVFAFGNVVPTDAPRRRS